MHSADIEAASGHPAKNAQAARLTAGSKPQPDGQHYTDAHHATGSSAVVNGGSSSAKSHNAANAHCVAVSKPAKRHYKLWGWRWTY